MHVVCRNQSLVPLFCPFFLIFCLLCAEAAHSDDAYRLKIRERIRLAVCTCFCPWGGDQNQERVTVKWTWSGWWRYSRVKRNQRTVEGGKGWGGGKGLGGGLGVTLMECHSTFEWWEADNQSDVAPEFTSSQASTLSSAINNAMQHLITVYHSQRCHTREKRLKKKLTYNVTSTYESSGNWISDSLVEL